MSVRSRAAREPEVVLASAGPPQTHSPEGQPPMVQSHGLTDLAAGSGFSRVDFGNSARLSMMLVPRMPASSADQLDQILETQSRLLGKHKEMRVTSQTVFLRDQADRKECQRLIGK